MFIARRHASRLLFVLSHPTVRLPGCLAVRLPGCHTARLPSLAWPGSAPSQHEIYDPGVCDSRFKSGVAKVGAEPSEVMRLPFLNPEPHKFQGPAHEFCDSRFKSGVAKVIKSKLALEASSPHNFARSSRASNSLSKKHKQLSFDECSYRKIRYGNLFILIFQGGSRWHAEFT